MTDATLLHAILDNPDDIAARRVYADALIAAGDPRGELINVQCAFALARLHRDQRRGSRGRSDRRAFRASRSCHFTAEVLAAFPALRPLRRADVESPAKSMLKPLLDRGIRVE